MKRFAMAATLGTGLLLSAWQVDAQWRYTDDRGTNKVQDRRARVLPRHRGADWTDRDRESGPQRGPGPGRPALGRGPANRGRGAGLLQFKNVQAPTSPRWDSGAAGKPMATMCIAGELRTMTSPGSWKVVGACGAGLSTGYGTDGYGSFGGFSVR